MKKKFILLSLTICLIIANSCKKSSLDTSLTSFPPQLNKPPVVNAGDDQTVSAGCNKASLSGSASDSTGFISADLWKQVSGPTLCSIVSPNKEVTQVTNIVEGVYRFALEVDDNLGASAADTTEITVVSNVPEIIFSNLTWSYFPNDIPNDEPRLTVLPRPDLFCDTSRIKEVAIQVSGSSDWIPLTRHNDHGNEYVYNVFWGSDLRIFGFSGWLIGNKASVRVKFL
jgi:hypothetical protein